MLFKIHRAMSRVIHAVESTPCGFRYRDLGTAILGKRKSDLFIAPFQYSIMVRSLSTTCIARKLHLHSRFLSQGARYFRMFNVIACKVSTQ